MWKLDKAGGRRRDLKAATLKISFLVYIDHILLKAGPGPTLAIFWDFKNEKEHVRSVNRYSYKVTSTKPDDRANLVNIQTLGISVLTIVTSSV